MEFSQHPAKKKEKEKKNAELLLYQSYNRHLLGSPVHPAASIRVNIYQNKTFHRVWIFKLKQEKKREREGEQERIIEKIDECNITASWELLSDL